VIINLLFIKEPNANKESRYLAGLLHLNGINQINLRDRFIEKTIVDGFMHVWSYGEKT